MWIQNGVGCKSDEYIHMKAIFVSQVAVPGTLVLIFEEKCVIIKYELPQLDSQRFFPETSFSSYS